MRELLANLQSLSWWVTAVLAGLAVNLASAYLKPWLDAIGAKRSTARRELLRKNKESRMRRIAVLQGDPTQQILETVRAFGYRGVATSHEVGAVAIFLLAQPITDFPWLRIPMMLGGAFLLLFAQHWIRRQWEILDEVRAARFGESS